MTTLEHPCQPFTLANAGATRTSSPGDARHLVAKEKRRRRDRYATALLSVELRRKVSVIRNELLIQSVRGKCRDLYIFHRQQLSWHEVVISSEGDNSSTNYFVKSLKCDQGCIRTSGRDAHQWFGLYVCAAGRSILR